MSIFKNEAPHSRAKQIHEMPSFDLIKSRFNSRKEMAIVKCLLENGISVRQGTLYINHIRISVGRVAEYLGLDARTVKKIVKEIEEDTALKLLFRSLRARPSFEVSASYYDQAVLEIVSESPTSPGLLAKITSIIARHGATMKYLIGDDGMTSSKARLRIVLDRVPAGLIDELRRTKLGITITVTSRRRDDL